MHSIVNYSSDENSDEDHFSEATDRKQYNSKNSNRKTTATNDDDNYDEVGMDMSEASEDSNGSSNSNQLENDKHKHKRSDDSPIINGSRSPKYRKSETDDRRTNRNYRDEDRFNSRYKKDNRKDRSRHGGDDRTDKYRDSKDSKRGRSSRNDKFNRDRFYDRNRSKSRERTATRRSRSRDDRRSTRDQSRKSRSRSRSNSKDRTIEYTSKLFSNSRRDKNTTKMNRLDKLGIDFIPSNYQARMEQTNNQKSITDHTTENILMPSLTGRFREQVERRKQLWQKSKTTNDHTPTVTSISNSSSNNTMPFSGGSKAAKVYEATTFADDKTSSKFKRLMGIKDSTGPVNLPTKTSEVLKKQAEMFSSMEAQYEVARTATHTMRGVGLGFGSFQKP